MVAERVGGLEQRILLVETTISEMKEEFAKTIKDLTDRVMNVQATTLQIGDNLDTVQAEVAKTATSLNVEKARLAEELNAEFDRHKLALVNVTNAAREEFLAVKDNIMGLHTQTAQAFKEVQVKVNELEEKLQHGGRRDTRST